MYTKSLLRGAVLLTLSSQALCHVLVEQLDSVPTGWAVKSVPSDDTKITLEVALVQNNITEMVAALMAVSDPTSSFYGKYWSRAQVDDLLAPSTEAVEATTSWLKSSGAESVKQAGSYIAFRTTVGKANAMLNAKFTHYTKDGVTKLRTTSYSVSKEVAEHVDFLHPTTFFGKTQGNVVPSPPPASAFTKTKRDVSRRSVPAACITGLTPTCVKDLYNIPLTYVPDITSGASIGYGSFLNQSSVSSDLFLFEETFNILQQNFTTVIFDNGLSDQNATTAQDGEANLDVQNIVGVSHPIPVTEFITGGFAPFDPDLLEPLGSPSNEPYLVYYKALLAMTDEALPQVISNSYGDDEQSVPPKYAANVCNLIGAMGLRGVTILESSGDDGVGSACITNDKKAQLTFNPIFPATCPYVTSVGGTMGIPEIAWVGSSGGFSNYFARAYYQQTAVNTYVNKHVKPSTALYLSQFTNFSGRGFPDVAAMSVSPYYYGFYDGAEYRNGGTSAASPVWAGIVGLLNSARLKAGLPTMGFMNPWLYSTGYNALTDITGGYSIGCNGQNTQTGGPVPGDPTIPYAQWNATKGWDPTTGWGVPDFQAMLKLALKG